MPFTISHAAAALPFRRLRLVPSALVIGTFAPDIEYFVRLAPGGGWGHTIPGAFGLSLPLGLVTLWMYQRFVKVPASYLLPLGIQLRMQADLGHFRFFGMYRFFLILISLLVGIATHIGWDSFTHSDTWLYDHWMFLHRNVHILSIRYLPVFELLQYISSALGIAALWLWFIRWYRSASPSPELPRFRLSIRQRSIILAVMFLFGFLVAVARGYIGIGFPENHREKLIFYGEIIVTALATVWWQLIVWGFFFRSRAFRLLVSSEQPYTQARS